MDTNILEKPIEDQRIDHIVQNSEADILFANRVVEALLFSSQSPLSISDISQRLPKGIDARYILRRLQAQYEGRGVQIIEINQQWVIRTAPDLADFMIRDIVETKKLSKSAIEILGIIAYHQPVTRTEIETIRGVAVSKGTLDLLMEIGWIRLGKRRETPGRPVTFITTDEFLDHYGLRSIKDLPGLKELKEAGFLDSAGREVTDDEMKSLLMSDDDDKRNNDDNDNDEQYSLLDDDLFSESTGR